MPITVSEELNWKPSICHHLLRCFFMEAQTLISSSLEVLKMVVDKGSEH